MRSLGYFTKYRKLFSQELLAIFDARKIKQNTYKYNNFFLFLLKQIYFKSNCNANKIIIFAETAAL
jgi:hypothetical protein